MQPPFPSILGQPKFQIFPTENKTQTIKSDPTSPYSNSAQLLLTQTTIQIWPNSSSPKPSFKFSPTPSGPLLLHLPDADFDVPLVLTSHFYTATTTSFAYFDRPISRLYLSLFLPLDPTSLPPNMFSAISSGRGSPQPPTADAVFVFGHHRLPSRPPLSPLHPSLPPWLYLSFLADPSHTPPTTTESASSASLSLRPPDFSAVITVSQSASLFCPSATARHSPPISVYPYLPLGLSVSNSQPVTADQGHPPPVCSLSVTASSSKIPLSPPLSPVKHSSSEHCLAFVA